MSFLKSIDIFGSPINMKIGGSSNLKSTIGGVITILHSIVLSLVFLTLLVTAFYNKTGSIISYSEMNEALKVQNFTIHKDITFVFGIMSKLFQPIVLDTSIFEANLYINYYYFDDTSNIQFNYSYKVYAPITCTPEILTKNHLPTAFKDNYICFNITDKEIIKFGGDIFKDTKENYGPKFYIGPKQTLYQKDANYTKKYDDYFLKSVGSFVMSITYDIPQVVNLNVPIKTVRRFKKFKIGDAVNLNMAKVNFTSYDSLLPIMEPMTKIFYTVESFDTITSINKKFELNIVQSENDQFVLRRYDRIDLYIAKFLALNNLVYLILKFVSDYLTTNYLNLYLINKFFRFDEDDGLDNLRKRKSIIMPISIIIPNEILPKDSLRNLQKGGSINEEILEKSI